LALESRGDYSNGVEKDLEMRLINLLTTVLSRGASFSPEQVSGLTMWCEASELSLNDGDAVQTFTDLSGNNHSPTQAVLAKRPTYKTNIINGHAALLFDGLTDGNGDVLRVGFTRALPQTVFAVFQVVTPADTKIIFSGYDNPGRLSAYLYSTGGSGLRISSGVDLEYPAAGTDTWQIWVFEYNGASSNIYKAGSVVKSGNAGTSVENGITIGASPYFERFGTNAGTCINMYLASQLIYDRILTTSERNAVGAWLAEKYGLNF